MSIYSNQNVYKVFEWIYVMQFAAGDKGLHDSDRVSTDFRPTEEPVFSA